MKRNKLTAIILTVLFIMSAMSLIVSAATAELVEIDKTTGGNWVGNYGSDGYIIITDDDSLQSIPSYAKLEYANQNDDFPSFWTWYDSESDEDADEFLVEEREHGTLYKTPAKQHRLAACYYSGEFFSVTVDVGSEAKIVTMYMLDYDSVTREANVTAYDESGKKLIEPIEVVDYFKGWYLKFKISGKVQFMFEHGDSGANVVLSGIFFDPDPAAVAAAEAAAAAALAAAAVAAAPVEAAPAPAAAVAPAPAPVAAATTAPRTSDGLAVIVFMAFAAASGIIVMRRKTEKI